MRAHAPRCEQACVAAFRSYFARLLTCQCCCCYHARRQARRRSVPLLLIFPSDENKTFIGVRARQAVLLASHASKNAVFATWHTLTRRTHPAHTPIITKPTGPALRTRLRKPPHKPTPRKHQHKQPVVMDTVAQAATPSLHAHGAAQCKLRRYKPSRAGKKRAKKDQTHVSRPMNAFM